MLSLLLAQAFRLFPSDQVGGSFSVAQYASLEDTGPGFQKARAAGQTSVACTSLHGMALSCHPERSEGSLPGPSCHPEHSEGSLPGPSCHPEHSEGSLPGPSCHPERSEGSLPGPSCHPERSEGSLSMGVEMLRCAQHDSVRQHDKGCPPAAPAPAERVLLALTPSGHPSHSPPLQQLTD